MATVTGNKDDGYTFTCADCGFVSSGWPMKSAATKRGEEHAREHETGEAMPELADSEAAQ